MKELLTIIIPCKNEESYIGNLLQSLNQQIAITGVQIIIADASSTDNTLEIIHQWSAKLNIIVINGGLPAAARNKGAHLARTKYLLFIDADATLEKENMILNSINKMEKGNLDLLAARLNSKFLIAKLLYKLNNIIIWLSKFDKPFAVGIYMMMRREKFQELGGFPEWALHCEDYLLSKKVQPKKFGIINQSVYSDNRRFKKMGNLNMIKYIYKNIKERNNPDHFKENINYWK
jgi:glycosyltransferase involved in cell wall biosynthesis